MKVHKIKSRIWNVRTEKAVNIQKLSQITGIGKSTLYNYENDKISPPIENLGKIADALGVEIEELYTKEEI